MTRQQMQRLSPRRPAAYRRLTVPVPVKPQNDFEELGQLLFLGAMFCFAAGAIARTL